MILDSFKNKTPCFHRTILIQIDSPLPQDNTQAVSRQSDVELHNKGPLNIKFPPVLSVILNGSKNKSPCFHRTILIQIYIPLHQHETQAVSRQSDVELQNKSTPNLIFHVFCLWIWMAFKRKLSVSTEQFQFRLTVHYARMTLKQFQDNLMLNYKIKALQISYSTSSACEFGWLSKGNSLFPQKIFNSNWQSTTPGWHSSSFKTIWCWITK